MWKSLYDILQSVPVRNLPLLRKLRLSIRIKEPFQSYIADKFLEHKDGYVYGLRLGKIYSNISHANIVPVKSPSHWTSLHTKSIEIFVEDRLFPIIFADETNE